MNQMMIIMSFNDFDHTYNLKKKAKTEIKTQIILSSLSLSDVGIYLRDGSLKTLHPTKDTHWVAYNNQNYFDSKGCSPHQKLSKFIIKRNGICSRSE